MSPRPQKLTRVGDLVARYVSQRPAVPEGTRGGRTTLRVFEAFRAIGPPVTEHVEPTSLRGGMLWVTVAESAWLTELTFLKQTLVERINLAVGREAVKDIRFRLGKLTAGKKNREAEPPPPPPLTARQSAQVAEWGSAIPDPDVRAAVERAAARSLGSPKKGRPPAEGGPPGPRGKPPVMAPQPPPPAPPADRWAKNRDRWKDRKVKREK